MRISHICCFIEMHVPNEQNAILIFADFAQLLALLSLQGSSLQPQESAFYPYRLEGESQRGTSHAGWLLAGSLAVAAGWLAGCRV